MMRMYISWLKSLFVFLIRCLLVFFLVWGGLVHAHPGCAMHGTDMLETFEGYARKEGLRLTPFTQLLNQFNAHLDTSKIRLDPNQFKLPETLKGKLDPNKVDEIVFGFYEKHRDLYHGMLFGEAIPKDNLDAVIKTFRNQCEKQYAVRLTAEEAKDILMQARSAYIREGVNLVQEMTGLTTRRAARGLAGLFQIIHLLGDSDPTTNKAMEMLPDIDRLITNAERCLDDLCKGGNEQVMKHLAKNKAYLECLRKVCKGKDPIVARTMLRQWFQQKAELGVLLDQRWGRTLAKKGIRFDAKAAKVMVSDWIKKSILSDTSEKGLEKLTENTGKSKRALMRQVKSGLREADNLAAATGKKGMQVVTQVAVAQTLRSASGKTVQVLTVPVKQVTKGVLSGVSGGVLTLVFSQGVTYAMYQQGALTDEEFVTETEKNCGAALVAGSTTFVLVSLGFGPVGWVAVGVGITTDLLYGMAFDHMQWVNSFSWEEDWVFGEVPTDIQRRRKIFEGSNKALFTFPDRVSFLDALSNPEIARRTSPLDWSNNPEIQKRVSPLDWSASEEIGKRKPIFSPTW